MAGLKLNGMKAAFDEIITTVVKRQHEPQQIVADLLNAEITEKELHSIKCRIALSGLPLAGDIGDFTFDGTPFNETLVHNLLHGNFLAHHRNVVLVGGTDWQNAPRHRDGAQLYPRWVALPFFSVVDLVNKLEAATRSSRQGR